MAATMAATKAVMEMGTQIKMVSPRALRTKSSFTVQI